MSKEAMEEKLNSLPSCHRSTLVNKSPKGAAGGEVLEGLQANVGTGAPHSLQRVLSSG